jgi:hypothetical protein
MDKEVRKIAVTMTMTEGTIELARSTDVDAIIAHHPIADATNSGGVELSNYLQLYDLAAFELHEAFHGLHPGIPYLHGHRVHHVEIAFGNIHGNILFVGQAFDDVNTLGDMLNRLQQYMGLDQGMIGRFLTMGLATLLVATCRTVQDLDAPPDLGDGLDVGTPAMVGLRLAPLHALRAAHVDGSFPNTTSVLILKDGKLVFERYSARAGPTS